MLTFSEMLWVCDLWNFAWWWLLSSRYMFMPLLVTDSFQGHRVVWNTSLFFRFKCVFQVFSLIMKHAIITVKIVSLEFDNKRSNLPNMYKLSYLQLWFKPVSPSSSLRLSWRKKTLWAQNWKSSSRRPWHQSWRTRKLGSKLWPKSRVPISRYLLTRTVSLG